MVAGSRILLVRLRLIGDVVFTTPIPRALRRRYPNAHITYVVEPMAEPIVRGNPHLDEIIVIPKRRGLARWRDDWSWARRLRAGRFDIAIDLHGGPRGAWLTWASGAPMRIGYQTPGRTWMYTHAVERPEGLLPRHSVRNQWDLLAPLGFDACEPTRDAVEMAPRVVHTPIRAESEGWTSTETLFARSSLNATRRSGRLAAGAG